MSTRLRAVPRIRLGRFCGAAAEWAVNSSSSGLSFRSTARSDGPATGSMIRRAPSLPQRSLRARQFQRREGYAGLWLRPFLKSRT